MHFRRRLMVNSSVARAHAAFLRCAAIVSISTGVHVVDIVGRQFAGRPHHRSDSAKAFARRASVYLTVTSFNVRQGTLARALGRSRTRVFHDMQEIENLRERPAIDELFDRMEAML